MRIRQANLDAVSDLLVAAAEARDNGGSRKGAPIAADIRIPLAEAVRALRRELVEAVRQAEGEEIKFALGPVQLELQVEVSNETGGEAGIAFWLVSIGAKASRASATTHSIKLSLSPVSATGPIEILSQVEERP
jgi:hypothetical protein